MKVKKKLVRRVLKPYRPRVGGEERKARVEDALTRKATGVKVSETQLVASICKESFEEFVKEFWPVVSGETLVWNWHMTYLCHLMQRMVTRVVQDKPKLYDAVVNVPPGTSKSTIMSVMLLPWAWVHMPGFKLIGASYAADLSMDLGRKARDVIESDKYRACFPHVVLRSDQNTKGYYLNTAGGFRYAVGSGGMILGRHAHSIIIDDPIDPTATGSDVEIRAINNWIDQELSTRKVSKTVSFMALVMQRLHQDDPTALFLKRRNVFHVKLPAELADGPKPAHLGDYYRDGLMDKYRMPQPYLDEEKRRGEYYYSSQFRQDPVPPGGLMFHVNRVGYARPPQRFKSLCRFWDKAGTLNDGAYTAGVLVGEDYEKRIWILDVVRVRLDSAAREKLILDTARRDTPKVLVGVEQEPGSGGKESAENTVKNLRGFRVRVLKASNQTGGKVERADPLSVQCNAGNLYLPEVLRGGNNWTTPFLEELKYFPHSRFKDQVDAAAGGLNTIAGRNTRVGAMRGKSKE